MTWENVASCGSEELPFDSWMEYCYQMAIDYLGHVLGDPPAGCELGIMWHEHDLGDYPSLGVHWDFPQSDPPWTYIRKCEIALSKFDEAVEWFDISPGEIDADLEAAGLLESNDESEIQEFGFDADSHSDAMISVVATRVYKLRGLSDVLVLWPPGGGPSLIRDEGSWAPSGKITGAEIADAWILVEDENEASKLIKEAMSSSTVKPAA